MTTLFLKYRPKIFADLDSFEARESLIKLFTSDKIPHALLLTGPRGIGKTSAARIIAKALICDTNQNKNSTLHEPCNNCISCQAVDNGSHLDVLEIDAASNRGIDDARDLRDKIKLSPAQAKYKIFIIDEVHMLTNEAFNALLKTLEEPPQHAFFILCTTDFEKLPKTIVSRCTRVHFKRAAKSEVLSRLKKIAELEHIDYDDMALAVLNNSCDGSFRDAIKLLEQTSSLGKVTVDSAMKVVGLNNDFPVDQLLTFLEKEQIKEALDWVNKANEANLNFKLIIQEMVERLRQLMLKSFGVIIDPGLSEFVFSLEQIRRLVNLLRVANYELKQSPVASLPLEMAVIDYLANTKTLVSEDNGPVGVVDKSTKLTSEESSVIKSSVADKVMIPSDIPIVNHDINLENAWSTILEEVKPLNHSVLAFLRASRPLTIDDTGSLTIEVFYKFHKDQLETDRCRKIFEQAAGKVLARNIKLKCVLGEGKPLAVHKEEVVYEVRIDSPLPKKSTDDIIDMAEQIFNGGGTVQ